MGLKLSYPIDNDILRCGKDRGSGARLLRTRVALERFHVSGMNKLMKLRIPTRIVNASISAIADMNIVVRAKRPTE